MFASNTVMYFIILTTAATLHAGGIHSIATAQQAAQALRPLAGAGAFWLFAAGLIGTGMLAVPVLAGSCAYAVAEAAAWRGSLDRRPQRAKKFYLVIVAAMAIGLGLNYAGLDAIKMLFVSAVVNGLLAPPLMLIVILLTRDARVMGSAVNSRMLGALGWTAFAIMLASSFGLLFAS
jgi:Mn2+/Fe2+ NRAMP family transporter